MKVVVTGGAGFIGSHLSAAFLAEGNEVRVVDDLSSGYDDNVPADAELERLDISSDPGDLARAMKGAELVVHQAARRAVQSSVDDPIGTEQVNVIGSINVMRAAKDAGARRVLFSSSSSVYGGADKLPTPEDYPVDPKSPYAVSKLAAEHYVRVFGRLNSVETISLRYFNVFGPRQRPDSAYAAVIPLFIAALRAGEQPEIHGDGKQERDFTFVDNVVRANLLAAGADAGAASGRVFNIACGERISILDLLQELSDIMGVTAEPRFVEPRAGDITQSHADISAARHDLGYEPHVDFRSGLRSTVEWFLGR